jgi:hypothetical protein
VNVAQRLPEKFSRNRHGPADTLGMSAAEGKSDSNERIEVTVENKKFVVPYTSTTGSTQAGHLRSGAQSEDSLRGRTRELVGRSEPTIRTMGKASAEVPWHTRPKEVAWTWELHFVAPRPR